MVRPKSTTTMQWAICAWLLLIVVPSYAQISGVIRDPDGVSADGVEIFLNGSMVHAKTNEFGQFALTDCPTGLQEIVAYKKGYLLYRAPLRIQPGRHYTLKLQFEGKQAKIRASGTPESLKTFESSLLGEGGSLFINPESKLAVQEKDGKFKVLSGPFWVEHPAEGYRITAYFDPGTFQETADAAYFFQEYAESNIEMNMAIERSRMEAYRGSIRHWLSSIAKGRADEQGFSVTDTLGNKVELTPSPSSTEGYSRIQTERLLIIHYRDQESKVAFAGPVDFNARGFMINSRNLKVSGAMNQPSLARQLPVEYKPIENVEETFGKVLRSFYEKVYVQTDKPYYYPGEPVWFKAYINYYNWEWRDSLSQVLYVDLLTERKEAKLQLMFPINMGMSQGDFFIPASLSEGTYYLRAYTSVRLNYGDSGLFTKPVRILGSLSRPDPTISRPLPDDPEVLITASKTVYQTRDKIELTIQLRDDLLSGGADLSIAVTDAAQVIAVPDPINIVDTYPIDSAEIPNITDLVHPIERGIGFRGKFLNNKGRPEKSMLNFVQWNTGDLLFVQAGDDGMFWQTGLQFTDSATFSYKSEKTKNVPYGKVVILPPEIPSLRIPYRPEWKIVTAGSVQRIFSEYEVPKDTKMLQEIEIRGTKINDPSQRKKKRPYGYPDYVVKAESLNQGMSSLLYALVGRVPGLMIVPSSNQVYFSRSGRRPLIMVNGVPMTGDPGVTLFTIDINTVETIEVTSRLNAALGAQGMGGVIDIYTKSGPPPSRETQNFQTIKLPGFSRSRKFQSPDYEHPTDAEAQADYRATLYWNPEFTVDGNGRAAITFFASDLAGQYRVVVEGVTAEGEPVRGEALITVEFK